MGRIGLPGLGQVPVLGPGGTPRGGGVTLPMWAENGEG